MKTKKLKLPRLELVRELGYIPFKGLESMTAEEFMNNQAHPIYSAFTGEFVRKLNTLKAKDIDAEIYTRAFLTVMADLLQRKGEHDLTPGRLYKVHNYFDLLTDTVSPRVSEEYGKDFAKQAKEHFSRTDFYDLYERFGQEVA